MRGNPSRKKLVQAIILSLSALGLFDAVVISRTWSKPQEKNKSVRQRSNADPWNQFRGPNGSGVVNTATLPNSFGANENLIWSVSLPVGHSSPVLTSRYIFVTGHEGDQLLTLCIDRDSGALLWKRMVKKQRTEHRNALNDAAAASPVTDGANVYVFFPEYGLLSYNERGDRRWEILLGPFNSMHGLGTSPILVDDTVILQCDHDSDSYLLAVDKDRGSIKWKSERPGIQSGYSTPVVMKNKSGIRQLLIAGTFEIAGYSLEKGERLWRTSGLAFQAKGVPVIGADRIYYNNVGFEAGPLPNPGTFAEALTKDDLDGDKKISQQEFASSSWSKSFRSIDSDRNGFLTENEWRFLVDAAIGQNSLLAITPEGKGDLGRSHVQWTYTKSLPDVPSTILYEGVLYLIRNGGIFTALDPQTGMPFKQGRIPGASGAYYASPIAADGKLFLLSQEGKLTVVKAGKEWEMLSVSNLGEDCMATPAIGNGRLYVRTRESLKCFGKSE